MRRRELLQIAAAGIPFAAAQNRKHLAAIIGQTGAGDYGHDWDVAWNGLESVSVVAVADPDDAGRRRAAERSHAQRTYADYREMLQKEKPAFVGICSRSPAQRLEMVKAAAEAGAHMLIEKPLAQDLVTADEIVRTADEHRVKIQVGLVMRTQPAVLQARRMVEAGEIGVVQELRTRGKEDSRAGGEDMAVLGPHLFDLMRLFAGDPQWVFAHVTENGQEIGRKPIRQATEPVGPIAGNQVAALFAFRNGVHGYFASKTSDVLNASRFGFYVYGSKGAIFLGITKYPEQTFVLQSSSWMPDRKGAGWRPIEAPDSKPLTRDAANTIMARDLIGAVEEDRQPASSAASALWTVEMLQGVYLSQTTGRPAAFPLQERRHPLENL